MKMSLLASVNNTGKYSGALDFRFLKKGAGE